MAQQSRVGLVSGFKSSFSNQPYFPPAVRLGTQFLLSSRELEWKGAFTAHFVTLHIFGLARNLPRYGFRLGLKVFVVYAKLYLFPRSCQRGRKSIPIPEHLQSSGVPPCSGTSVCVEGGKQEGRIWCLSF